MNDLFDKEKINKDLEDIYNQIKKEEHNDDHLARIKFKQELEVAIRDNARIAKEALDQQDFFRARKFAEIANMYTKMLNTL
ncbi:MAG TPA: hypothetical protein VN704_10245 [Verrucomicrobiae bacterium]|nr:hypothetical protein [Verrucomicrobiae bacterium]